MKRTVSGRTAAAAMFAAHLIYVGAIAAPAPAAAMQILEAADHAELTAEISARDVSRIALSHDRIARVVRSPAGFAVEHDPASGDLYLRPLTAAQPDRGLPAAEPGSGADGAQDPVTLFIGTERGFTYRLSLIPADRGSAQILIRNADAAPAAHAAMADAGDPRVAALVRLVRAVARREPLPGYAIEAPGATGPGAVTAGELRIVETWRGPRFAAHVLEADDSPSAGTPDAAGLAGTMAGSMDGARVVALWLAAPGTGPGGGRLAVAVTEPASGAGRSGESR